MKSRKCDTAKYRRRAKKQKANRAVRQQKEILVKAYVEAPEEVGVPGALALELRGPKMTAMSEMGQQTVPAVICPLCKQQITVDDVVEKNIDTIIFNHERVQVHKVCPTEMKK